MSEPRTKCRLGKLTRLNPNTAKPGSALRGKAPHKPLLLLGLLDMAEAGELTSPNGRSYLLNVSHNNETLATERMRQSVELHKELVGLRKQLFDELSWDVY